MKKIKIKGKTKNNPFNPYQRLNASPPVTRNTGIIPRIQNKNDI